MPNQPLFPDPLQTVAFSLEPPCFVGCVLWLEVRRLVRFVCQERDQVRFFTETSEGVLLTGAIAFDNLFFAVAERRSENLESAG